MKKIILIFVLILFLSGCCILSLPKKASDYIDKNPNIENKQSAKILTKYIEDNKINATLLEDKENKVVIKYNNKNYDDEEKMKDELTKLGIGLLLTYPNAKEYVLTHDLELNSSIKKVEISAQKDLVQEIIQEKNASKINDYIKIKIDGIERNDLLNLTTKEEIIKAIEK